MLNIKYHNGVAKLSWDKDDLDKMWLSALQDLIVDNSIVLKRGLNFIEIPWWNFMAISASFKCIYLVHKFKYSVCNKSREFLIQANQNEARYENRTVVNVTQKELEDVLKRIGFNRTLSPEQKRNVSKMVALPAAGTFSVPGAGKTTEALSFFFYKAQRNEKLLVIAPKNAFAAWEEEINSCMPGIKPEFKRLTGGSDNIKRILSEKPRFLLINYQQLPRVLDLIREFLSENETFVFLDESHRIKSGHTKITARAVLEISHLAVGKLIMSGTPMPQAKEDLIPQFSFLYPGIEISSDNIISKIEPIYVRTTKAELKLPPVKRIRVPLPMTPLQTKFYNLMKSEVARSAEQALTFGNKKAFRALGRSVLTLMRFVSNPMLVASDINNSNLHNIAPELLEAVLAEGDGPKIKYVLDRARKLASEGKKVLIWSSSVHNVEYIAQRLSDIGSVYIHGQVGTGDENDELTREGKIKKFKEDGIMVMVANPAAASEGISLHHVCHHAIYLDRTFNAAHYIQSEDRIHRFGLAPNQETTIEIVECESTVDQIIDQRLNYKIELMANVLNDSSLHTDPIVLDPHEIEDYKEYELGLTQEDVEELFRYLRDEKKAMYVN